MLKSSISSFWEAPSSALVSQSDEAGPLLDTAMGEAEELLNRARALAATLGEYDITLTVPPSGGVTGAARGVRS